MAELIVICVDNSSWMPRGSAKFQTQCDAIKLYCQAKFEANQDTVVGLFTMSSLVSRHLLHPPTGSLQKIVAELSRIYTGDGKLDLLNTLSFGRMPFVDKRYKNRRMALFVGGLTNLCNGYAKDFGKSCKDMGIAVDVFDFYQGKPPKFSMSDYRFGWSELQTFVNICNGNDNDNSHIVHIGPKCCIRNVLSKSILKQTPEKENVDVKRRVGGEESSAADDGN